MILIAHAWVGVLLIVLLLALYWRPLRSRTQTVLCALLYVFLILALAGISLRLPERSGTLLVLVDRSYSMPENFVNVASGILREIDVARPDSGQLGVVSFSSRPMSEKLPGSPGTAELKADLPDRDASDLAEALEFALQQIPEHAGGRILLLSDGLWSGRNPEAQLAQAAARNIAVDFRFFHRDRTGDLAVTTVQAPAQAAPLEYYTLEYEILSPAAQTATARIRKNNGPWRTRTLELTEGINRLSYRDFESAATVADYTFEILPQADLPSVDQWPENNRARRIIEITGEKKVLLLSDSPSANLLRVLREGGMAVDSLAPAPDKLTATMLAGYSGIILENVPASRLGADAIALIAEMVQNGTLGLMMTGGRSSFAVGGYYNTPIAEILPVALDQRNEVRRSSSAVLVALDRSGSMAMTLPGGMTKIAMANLATVEVFKLLAPDDEFGVIAVDSAAHSVWPLRKVAESGAAPAQILSIESMGGGIFVYTALHQATRELLQSTAQKRHLILFADAADAEEPGRFRELLQQSSNAGITVSVIALGLESDSDAKFLKEVAQLGKGLCYFSNRADELPRIFAEDTFVMARSVFQTEPVEAAYTSAVHLLPEAAELGANTGFAGYNLCYAKPGSDILLISQDEFNAPLVAVGRAGLGKVSALAAEADGAYTGRFAEDPGAPRLLLNLAQYMIVPENGSTDFLLTESLRSDGVAAIELHLDPARNADPFVTRPEVTTLIAQPGKPPRKARQPLEWVSPDRLELLLPLDGDAVHLSSVALDAFGVIALPPVARPYSPEYAPVIGDRRSEALMDAALSWGGVERLAPDTIWEDIPRQSRYFDLTWLFAAAALALLLLGVGERRFAWLANFRHPRAKTPPTTAAVAAQAPRKRPASTSPRRTSPTVTPPTAPTAAPSSPAEKPPDDLSSALRQVRKR